MHRGQSIDELRERIISIPVDDIILCWGFSLIGRTDPKAEESKWRLPRPRPRGSQKKRVDSTSEETTRTRLDVNGRFPRLIRPITQLSAVTIELRELLLT